MKLLITGDFCPHNRVIKLVKSGEVDLIFNDFLPLIIDSDYAITNLEAPVTNSTNKIKKIGPSLNAPIQTIDVLQKAGFTTVSLANNHIMDFGFQGLSDTLDICKERSISYVGAGQDTEEISKSLILETNGVKVAILNFCENEFSTIAQNGYSANPIDPVENYKQIQKAKQESDFVIVITHSGHEYYQLPSPRMCSLMRYYIDIGANAIINHHTHCISGYEIYKNAPIFYSLGNFSFDWENKRNSVWNNGFAVTLNIEKEKEITFKILPYRQGDTFAGIYSLTNTEHSEFLLQIERINSIIADESLLLTKFENFVSSRSNSILLSLEPYNNRLLKYLKIKKVIPSFVSKKKKTLLLNLIRCESHRDILIKSLQE